MAFPGHADAERLMSLLVKPSPILTLKYIGKSMDENNFTDQVLIITASTGAASNVSEPRRGSASTLTSKILNTQSVHLSVLQEQVNVFVGQMQEVMSKAPEKTGEFRLAEFEVSAGITIGGKGELKLALLATGEINGSVNAGLKFVFKRS
jgi:hypothetical protein